MPRSLGSALYSRNVSIPVVLFFPFLTLFLPELAVAQLSSLTIGGYTLVNEQRVSRTEIDLTFQAVVTNPGPVDALAVIATLTSRSPHTVVIEGRLTFGVVLESSTIPSKDTFTIRQDRRFPFFRHNLAWTISGIERPPPTVSDPCTEINIPCESTLIGPLVTFSTQNDVVVSTVASDGSEEIFLDWISAGNLVHLDVTFRNLPPFTYQQLESGLPSLKRANVTAAMWFGLTCDSPGNDAGCDWWDTCFPPFGSCSEHGACCDGHDFCIDTYCTGPNDSGNFFGCGEKEKELIACKANCPRSGSPNCQDKCEQMHPLCSDECQQCHKIVMECFLIPSPFAPGPAHCCETGVSTDCGLRQQCIIDGIVITDPCVCKAHMIEPEVDQCNDCTITNTCNPDPTFIQLSQRATDHTFRPRSHVAANNLTAKITVPSDDALVRADVPIIGLAYGENFKEYRVEYGEGTEPRDWKLIATSTEPQTKALTPKDLVNSLDVTIRGNLATWDTGLRTYVYLPSHPADHPIHLKGNYTIRLVVMGKDGSMLEDRVTVVVADVIPNAWGGVVRSTDEKITLIVPEQALRDSFRLIAIQPVEQPPVAMPSDRQLVGNVYEVREPGEKFTKASILRMMFTDAEIGGIQTNRLGMYGYNSDAKAWEYIPSTRREGENAVYIRLRMLHSHYALMASDLSAEGSTLESLPVAHDQRQQVRVAHGHYLVNNTFEDGVGEWSNRDNDVGGDVALDDTATLDGTHALRITNRNAGGNFAVNVVTTPFDARDYPWVQFDYQIPRDVKTNFLVKVAGRWYDIGFTDDVKVLQNQRVNIAHIGDIDGVVADDQWHTAQFNLYNMLRTKTGNTLVEQMIMADWDVSGFMKLQFGHNRKGATYYVDNFIISREVSAGRRMESASILVDHFNQKKMTNALGGTTSVFSDAQGGRVVPSFSPDDAVGKGHALALEYDVAQTGSYAGYVSALPHLDLRGYHTLTFFVKGHEGAQDLLVGLRDQSGHERKVLLSRYVPQKITTSWQHVVIPLMAFADTLDWSGIDSLHFAFENAVHAAGTVLVDSIEFHRDLQSVMVETFDGPPESNLLGGKRRTFTHGIAAINGMQVTSASNGIYSLSYGGNIGDPYDYGSGLSYAGWATELRGIDCSRCGTLSFRIRGSKGGETPSVYLDDGNFRWGVDLRKYTQVTSEWHEVTIPLHEFAEYGVDLTHLVELQVVFAWERMSGTIYLDDFRFGWAPSTLRHSSADTR